MSTVDLKARPVTLFYLALSVLLLAVFYLVTQQVFSHAPNVIKLDTLAIQPAQAPVVLGALELAQKIGSRSAEKQHLRLIFDKQHGWQIANIAKYRRIDAPGGEYKTRYLRRIPLQTGDAFSIAGEEFVVLNSQGRLDIEHRRTQQQLHWQGGQTGAIQTQQFAQNTMPKQTVCSEDRNYFKKWLLPYKFAFNEWLIQQHWAQKEETLLFKIGGSVTCLRRWGISEQQKPLFSPDSGRIYWLDNRYWLAPSGKQSLIQVKPVGQTDFSNLEQQYVPLQKAEQSIEQLILGRSVYKVFIDKENTLSLQQRSGDVWLAEDWQEQQKSYGNPSKNHPTPQMTAPETFAQNVFFWVNLFYILSLLVSLVFAMRGRLRSDSGLLWVLSLTLVCSGNLVLLQLAIGGLSERFLNLSSTFLKVSLSYQILLLTLLFMPLTSITQGVKNLFRINQLAGDYQGIKTYWGYLRQRSKQISFYTTALVNLLLAIYFIMLSMQAVGGLEAGVAGYQPVEFSKFIVIFISTISAVGYYEKRYLAAYNNQGSILWSVQQTLGLFLGLGGVVIFTTLLLSLVRDFSPIALIFLYLLLFCVRILPHPLNGSFTTGGKIIFTGLLFVLAIPVTVLVSTKLNGIPPSFLMNADRFQVWANPALYPHSGSQVIDSMRLISNSTAWGQVHWFSHNSHEIMRLPAVQDDFIATFLISHFGYLAGLSLLAVQLAFVWQLIRLSNGLLHDLQGTASARQLGYSGSLFCFGFAGLLIAHWLISWSNVLGLLPVMGQPMALLSSGGSNLMLFVVPCLLLSFCFAWIKEQ